MGFKSAKQSHNNRFQVGGLILPSKEIYNAYKAVCEIRDFAALNNFPSITVRQTCPDACEEREALAWCGRGWNESFVDLVCDKIDVIDYH